MINTKLKLLLTLVGVLSICFTVMHHLNSSAVLRLTWGENTNVDTSFVFDDPVVVEPSRILNVANPDLVVFVQSAHTRFHERERVRQTWARPSTYRNTTVVVFFTIGRSSNVTNEQNHQLRDEISAHGDILFQPFHDTYDNLTLKGLLTMRWISQKLSQNAYVIKTDDDVMLDLFLWIRVMKALGDRKVACGVVGFVWKNPVVIRIDTDPKHGVTREQYKRSHYPSFCSGAGYLMTPDAFRAILLGADHIPLFVRDDPYFTGIVTQALGIPLITFPKTHFKFFSKDLLIPEILTGHPLVVHGLSDSMWTFVWNSIRLGEQYGRTISKIALSPLKPADKGEKLEPLPDDITKLIASQAPCVPAKNKQMEISIRVS